ncbi:hypothetical protein T01_9082 [Trichinella spiralis]|uniref:Uncharacterized protein n=1 Tax=Trichinella spiralis TaxID=6334 RepID=A0A0V1AQ52_TRISP|nr:hypothetical protein T01_9082 [Trichinella spiralis]
MYISEAFVAVILSQTRNTFITDCSIACSIKRGCLYSSAPHLKSTRFTFCNSIHLKVALWQEWGSEWLRPSFSLSDTWTFLFSSFSTALSIFHRPLMF